MRLLEFAWGLSKETLAYNYRKTVSNPLKEMHKLEDPNIYDVIELGLLFTDGVAA